MCDLYWHLYDLGIPVLMGPSTYAKLLGCPTTCDCDVVIHVNDLERVGARDCVWVIDDPSFVHRYVWIRGLPHIDIREIDKIRGENLDVVKCIMDKFRSVARVQ